MSTGPFHLLRRKTRNIAKLCPRLALVKFVHEAPIHYGSPKHCCFTRGLMRARFAASPAPALAPATLIGIFWSERWFPGSYDRRYMTMLQKHHPWLVGMDFHRPIGTIASSLLSPRSKLSCPFTSITRNS